MSLVIKRSVLEKQALKDVQQLMKTRSSRYVPFSKHTAAGAELEISKKVKALAETVIQAKGGLDGFLKAGSVNDLYVKIDAVFPQGSSAKFWAASKGGSVDQKGYLKNEARTAAWQLVSERMVKGFSDDRKSDLIDAYETLLNRLEAAVLKFDLTDKEKEKFLTEFYEKYPVYPLKLAQAIADRLEKKDEECVSEEFWDIIFKLGPILEDRVEDVTAKVDMLLASKQERQALLEEEFVSTQPEEPQKKFTRKRALSAPDILFAKTRESGTSLKDAPYQAAGRAASIGVAAFFALWRGLQTEKGQQALEWSKNAVSAAASYGQAAAQKAAEAFQSAPSLSEISSVAGKKAVSALSHPAAPYAGGAALILAGMVLLYATSGQQKKAEESSSSEQSKTQAEIRINLESLRQMVQKQLLVLREKQQEFSALSVQKTEIDKSVLSESEKQARLAFENFKKASLLYMYYREKNIKQLDPAVQEQIMQRDNEQLKAESEFLQVCRSLFSTNNESPSDGHLS